MNFKVKGQLTNVRPSKTENPELIATCTEGNVKINIPGAKLLGLASGDLVTIVPAETDNGDSLFVVKGSAGNDGTNGEPKTPQVGALLSSISGTGAGALQFGSGNAWKELKGNKQTKIVYSISETPVEHEGKSYHELTFSREEAKAVREKKNVEA